MGFEPSINHISKAQPNTFCNEHPTSQLLKISSLQIAKETQLNTQEKYPMVYQMDKVQEYFLIPLKNHTLGLGLMVYPMVMEP